MLPEGMGFDMETLKVLTLGNGEISLGNLQAFCIKCYEVTNSVWATDRSNPPERQQLKQEFVDLMRDHVWVPTIACMIYVVLVFVGPSLVRSPWPVRAPSSRPPALTRSANPPPLAFVVTRVITGQAGADPVEPPPLSLQRCRRLPLHGRPARQRERHLTIQRATNHSRRNPHAPPPLRSAGSPPPPSLR